MIPIYQKVGIEAEQKVFDSLSSLNAPWQVFHSIEWRYIHEYKENIGECDVVIFHPDKGLLTIEIKAGKVFIKDGKWYYGSGKEMKRSPFSQARVNRFALLNRLAEKLGKEESHRIVISHAVWFPDLIFKQEFSDSDCPSREFLLDNTSLKHPEDHLNKLFNKIKHTCGTTAIKPWSAHNQKQLKAILAPDIDVTKPLSVEIEDSNTLINRATEDQIRVLSLLHSQNRLLIEGGAGSGKTRLAISIAQQHAKEGKKVLFTCFNKALISHIASQNIYENITILSFHDIVKHYVLSIGASYVVPATKKEQTLFFTEQSADMLFNAAQSSSERYDTIIVDEANDFHNTWWLAIEALGKENFNWYVFYDKQQIIYLNKNQWSAPFEAHSLVLTENLRNTKPIGLFAAKIGDAKLPSLFRTERGIDPFVFTDNDQVAMGKRLNQLLKDLVQKEYVSEEHITILSPYSCNLSSPEWVIGLKGFNINDKSATEFKGAIKVSTIHAFKGLESDVVIIFGLDEKMKKNKPLLYVGCTRAKSLLYILELNSIVA